MSGILIKNMEMPIGCDGWGTSCPLLQWGLGDVYCRITHRHFDSIEDCYKYAKERPSDCPLIEVPSADAVEVKHGKWIKKPHWEPLPWDCDPSLSSTTDDYDEKTHSEKVMWWHCSCCDYSPDRGWKPHLNFCANCGADMRSQT